MHKQIAAAIFLLFLRFESTSIRAKVITAINVAAKTIDPNAEVKSHLYAVGR